MFERGFLKNKVGLIAGGTSSMGLELLKFLTSHDAKVSVLGRQQEKIFKRRLSEALGEQSSPNSINYIECDIRNSLELSTSFSNHVEKFKGIDFVIHAAGNDFLCPLEKMSANTFSSALQTVVQGGFAVFQEALPWLRQTKSGRIISLGHFALDSHFHFSAHTGVAKSALLELTKSIALEWAPYGITANMVSPGPVDSGSLYRTTPGSKLKQELIDKLLHKRLVLASEVAQTIGFLLSPAAQMITAQHIAIDGGAGLKGISFLPEPLYQHPDPRELVVQADDMPEPFE